MKKNPKIMALRLILDEKIPILPPIKAPWIRTRIRLKMRIRIQGTQKRRIRIRILSPDSKSLGYLIDISSKIQRLEARLPRIRSNLFSDLANQTSS